MKEVFDKIVEILQNPVVANIITTVLIPVVCVAMKIFYNVSKKSTSNDANVTKLKNTISDMQKSMESYQAVLDKNTALEVTIVELIQTAFANSKLDNDSKQKIIEVATKAKGLINESAPKVKEAIDKSVEAIESVSNSVKELQNTIQEVKEKTYIEKLEEEVQNYESKLKNKVG